MNTTWIIAIVVAVLAIKGLLLRGFIRKKMAESEAGRQSSPSPHKPSGRQADAKQPGKKHQAPRGD